MAMLAQFSFYDILENLISAGVIGLISAGMLLVVLKHETRRQSASLERLFELVGRHEAELANIRAERASCELRAAHAFATKDEIVRMGANQSQRSREIFERIELSEQHIDEKIGSVHDRINTLATTTARLEAAKEG